MTLLEELKTEFYSDFPREESNDELKRRFIHLGLRRKCWRCGEEVLRNNFVVRAVCENCKAELNRLRYKRLKA